MGNSAGSFRPSSPLPLATRKSGDLGATQSMVPFPYEHDRPPIICRGFPLKKEDE